MAVTPYDQRLAMTGAREHERELESAYRAGRDKLPLPFDQPPDMDSDHQAAVRRSHAQGVHDRRVETARETARRTSARAQRVGRMSGGYLASAGRSVRDTVHDIPSPSGGGTFLGVLVGIAALALLFVALQHSGSVASVFTGFTNAAKWLISPSPLPI